MLHEIKDSYPVLTATSGYNVCLRVGGLDVNLFIVPKFDVIGLVGVSFLVGGEPLFLKIIKVSGAGLNGMVIGSSYFLRPCLKLLQVFCSPSGFQVGYHKTFTS